MSCLTHFDKLATNRPRTVVLATDNELAGTPLFTLGEAGAQAVKEHVLVMGISPGEAGRNGAPERQFRQVVESTGGQLMDITTDPAIEARITRMVDKQQRKAIMSAAGARSFDMVWPGALVMGVGLVGMVGMVVSAKRSRA